MPSTRIDPRESLMSAADHSESDAPHPRRWSTATLDPLAQWYHTLGPVSQGALRQATAGLDPDPTQIVSLEPSPELREALRPDLDPIRTALEEGRGFAILEGVPRDSDLQGVASYWLLGKCLGTPIEQNVQGTRLYDVRDTGQSVEYGARFSVTNSDSSYHTDNSFGDSVADYVGLFCLRMARSGGINHLVSGWTVYWELLHRDPNALRSLLDPFHVERRGGYPQGEAPTVRRPVIEKRDGELLFRYMRYWIQEGHEKAGEPLTVGQSYALDLLDETLHRPDLQAELTLQPGQILWLNNRWLLHSRTAFEDYSDPKRRRRLVRLWLEKVRQPDV